MDTSAILNEYYKDCGGETKLQSIVRNCVKKFGGIFQKDYDDFMSIANETMVSVLKSYNGSDNFETYLISCLSKKFKTEMTRRNRQKRCNHFVSSTGETTYLKDISLETPLNEDSELTIGDTLITEDNLIQNELSEETELYLKSLTKIQQKICRGIMDGYSHREIKAQLNLSDSEYSDNFKQMCSFERANILNINKNKKTNDENNEMESANMYKFNEQSCEKSKRKNYAVANIIRKMSNYKIRFDYPAQRESEQWPLVMKGNLISDILQDNPIPDLVLAEEVINGVPIIWNLDGKQRCTTLETFKRDVFKISPKVKRYMIDYYTTKRDENGNFILDENGNPQVEWQKFDIRNKKYSQLPDELKDRFNEYTFDAVQYINCTKEEISYHISRYNEGKPMNGSQKGIILLGYDFTTLVKSISSSSFFKECCNFGKNDLKNGVAEKIVAESIMAAYFTKEWKKDQSKMFEYIRDNANNEMFTDFDEYLSELEREITDELTKMFTTPDTFLWLGIYIKMRKLGLTARDYVKFLAEFKNSLSDKKINGKSFNDIVLETKIATNDKRKRGTKDSSVVIEKMNILETLMENYFNVGNCDNLKSNTNRRSECNDELIECFKNSDIGNVICYDNANLVASQSVDMAKTQCKNLDVETFELCLAILNEWSLNTIEAEKVFTEHNIPAFVGVATYAYVHELDKEGQVWFDKYASKGKKLLTFDELLKDFIQAVGMLVSLNVAS